MTSPSRWAEEVFQSLRPRDQAILCLYLGGKISQKRIAELFGITQARVSQIVRQTRGRLIPSTNLYMEGDAKAAASVERRESRSAIRDT